MGLYLRGNWYHFRKQLEGRNYYRALKIKRGQEWLLSARLQQIEEQIIAEHFGLPYEKTEDISFGDFKNIYIKKKAHKKSIERDEQRLNIIEEILGNPFLGRIKKPQIERLEKELFKRKIGSSTVNRYFQLLRNFFNEAVANGYLREGRNPIGGFEFFAEDETRRALSRGELKKILAAAKQIQARPKSAHQAVIYDLIIFALNTGMRIGEILFLKKSYIGKDGFISYPATETKTRSRRKQANRIKPKRIYLNPMARNIIKNQKSPNEYVFNVTRRNSNMVIRPVAKIRKMTGIKDFTFHQLRHTVSTFLATQVSLSTAKLVLGHSDLKTTQQFYTHPETSEQKRAMALIETHFRDMLS